MYLTGTGMFLMFIDMPHGNRYNYIHNHTHGNRYNYIHNHTNDDDDDDNNNNNDIVYYISICIP